MAQFSASFLIETGKLLDEFGALLLAHENARELSGSDIDRIFRILHTIKGSVGMMRLGTLEALTHALEDLFVALKQEGAYPAEQTPRLFDLLFGCIDTIRAALDDFARDGAVYRSFDDLIARVAAFRDAVGATNVLRVTLSEDCTMQSVRAFLIVSALRGVCPSLACYPASLESDADASEKIRKNGLFLRFPASYADAIRSALDRQLYIARIAPADAFPSDGYAPSTAGAHVENTVADQYIPVHLGKLDALQNLAGEMILLQNRLLGDRASEDALKLRRISEAMRSAVLALRMTNVSALFQRLHRTVREAGRKLNREIEFVATGADVEIDKGVLDALSESLVQIVRNAAVHGIESNEERMKAGKPLMGRIAIDARIAGTYAILSVTDDGRGISAEQVVETMRAHDLATDTIPDSPEALLALLMRPGVTTSAQADEMSGRGVGLDVVRTAVEALRGSVSLQTEPGMGTTFELRIPQSLAVMDCVCVGVGEIVFLMPTPDIYRIVRPRAEDCVRRPDGGWSLRFAEYALGVLDLGVLCRMRAAPPRPDAGIVLIVEGEKSAVAVYADTLLEPRRAAVKSLPALFERRGLRALGISGVSILDEARTGFILDAETLLDL